MSKRFEMHLVFFTLSTFLSHNTERNQSVAASVNRSYLEDRKTAIFYAAMVRDEDSCLEMVKLLIQYGADPRFKDNLKQTALYYLARDGKTKVLEYLLDRGCPIDDTDIYLQSPLYYAAREGKEETLRMLISRGANFNKIDTFSQTPLFYAARDGRMSTCRALIEYGANVNHIDSNKSTPLFWAKKFDRHDVVKLLIDSGAINTKSGKLSQKDLQKLEKQPSARPAEAKQQPSKQQPPSQPRQQPRVSSEQAPQPKAQPQPKTQPPAQPLPQPKIQPQPAPQPQQQQQHQPQSQLQQQPQPQPLPQSQPQPQSQPRPQPQVQPQTQPQVQPQPQPQPQLQPKEEQPPKHQLEPKPSVSHLPAPTPQPLLPQVSTNQKQSLAHDSASTSTKPSLMESELLKKRRKEKEETRIAYRLVRVDEGGGMAEIGLSDFEKFKEKYPEVAMYILNPDKLLEGAAPLEYTEEKIGWQKLARRVLGMLWKMKGAYLFHHPVDPVRLGIPDYFDIVRSPMDLGTIRTKLQTNVYQSCKEFVEDVRLVFSNCILYNGTESEVGRIGVAMQAEFRLQCSSMLEPYLR
eukprot:TRINITY_DN3145_c0_g5_i1.p1 TRINITY_DN3145_c0_g5~~TRINITY_DN3145_c0_g5_i1.p1  ORF type:complete len:575 (+),score=82.61 TRINITY_DN3145_c0_g5_i1:309-2033(+)